MNATLVRLIAGQVSVHASMTGLRMGMPLYALSLGHSPAEIGVLVALFAVSNALLALPWGQLVDRHGLKGPWLGIMAMAGSGSALAALVGTYWAFCVTALLVGAAVGLAQVAVQRYASTEGSNLQAQRELWGWLLLAPPAANLVGPALVGLLLDHAGSARLDRTALTWSCATVGVLALSSWAWIRGLPERKPVAGAAAQPASTRGEVLRQPGMRPLLVVAWAVASCWDLHAFVVPVLAHERGFSASTVGFILGAFALAAAVTRPFLPRLATVVPEPVLMTVAMGLTALLLLGYPWLPGPWSAGVCSALLGLTLGGIQPMLLSLLQQITPPDRIGRALGVRLMTVSATSVAMPLLFGTVGTLVGAAALFWAASLIAAGASRVAWSLHIQRRGPEHWTPKS
jgi:MFS family permease